MSTPENIVSLSDVNTGITKNRLRRRLGRGPGSGQVRPPVEVTTDTSRDPVTRVTRFFRVVICHWFDAFLNAALTTSSP